MILSKCRPRLCAVATIAVFALMVGCSGSGSRSPVQGSVSYDGQPVDDGGVAFLPEGDGPSAEERVRATGMIADGRYDFDARRGPFPGKYRVQIYWQKKTGKRVPGEGGVMKDETQQAIPAKYNTSTELVVEVRPGRNTLDFDLKK
jgi:hypothetical protein